MTTRLAQAGDVNVSVLNIINGAGDLISILPYLVNFELYESIQSPFMTASILISESIGLFTKLPIIGEELIEIEFETPDSGVKIRKLLFVDNLDTRASDNSTSTYVLHLTSVNKLKDVNLKHSKAYEGFGSDLVKDIFVKTLDSGWPRTSDIILIEPTANKIKFVSNFWTPFQCIDYIAKTSITNNDELQSPSYLFYEDNKTHNFRTISNIIKANSPLAGNKRFYFDAVNGRKSAATGTEYALLAEYETVLKMRVVSGFDYFGRHTAGAWANRVVDFNILTKSIDTRLYNYWYDFDASGHMGNYPAVSNQVQYDDHNSKITRNVSFTHAHNGIASDRRGDVAAKRIGLLTNLDYMSLEIEIHGRTDLKVGDLIDLRLQNFASAFINSDEGDTTLDQLWSGHYMITQMQHRLNSNRHMITMRVTKDAVNKPIVFPEKRQ